MPWQQPYVDPNTGGTFSQTHVRATDVQLDFLGQRISFVQARWVSLPTYSLGLASIERRDIRLEGSAFQAALGPQIAAAHASFRSRIDSLVDAYIGGLATMSGAIPTP